MLRTLILLFSILSAGPIVAGSVATSTPISKQQGDTILKELRSIRLLLEQQNRPTAANPRQESAPPQIIEVSIQDRPFLGDENAPLILVEFSDYQCPFCRRFHLNTFPEIKKQYVDTGKLRYVAMDLPLAFHANAQSAANAAHCADDQGKFWELRHAMLENADKLFPADIRRYAQQLNLNMDLFQVCLSEKPYQQLIDADMSTAGQAGLTGTPSFVLTANTGSHNIKGQKLVGAQPYAFFKSKLDAVLSKKQPLPAGKSMNSERYRLQSKVNNDGLVQ